MKVLKKNQVIIYTIVLMIMIVGYLNFTTKQEDISLETSMQMEANDDTKLADIGDAVLVNSNDVLVENTTISQNNLSIDENKIVNSDSTVSENIVQETNSNVEDEYFVKSKLERDTMYSQMMETYEKILNSTNSLETQKQVATQEITKINETKNSLMICENLIKTKGFDDNVIFVNGESISVIIGTEDIKPEEIAQIQNIISREMSAEIENIHISTK